MFKKIFLEDLTLSTQDKSSSEILSFINSLSEKFDVLIEDVENLKKKKPSKGTTSHPSIDSMRSDSSPSPSRSQSRQGRRARRKKKRKGCSWSKVYCEYSSKRPQSRDTACVSCGQIKWTKIQPKISDYS